MIFGLFTLAVAIFISGVSAFYSVTGLTAIFAAAFWPIVIMGSALEIGKITATVWLHKYWDRAGWQFKLYLVPAIVVLMLITSMGTYGYLAKAHMDQNITVGDSAAQVAILDEKIKTEQDNIAASRQALKQMDAQVDQMLGRTTDDKGANRAVQIRKNQAKERKSLQADITAAQKNIAQLQAERAPKAAESRKIEAEVGPIRYIAALIYGDNPDANLLERAVRWVIILLVFVFDPLALILILAAEQTIMWAREDKKKQAGWHQEWVPNSEAWPEWDDEVTDEQIAAIKQEANVSDDIEMTKFFEDGQELAKSIDDNNGHLPDNYASTQSYLKGPVSWFTSTSKEGWVPKQEPTAEDPLDIPILEGEEMWAQEAIDSRFDPQPIRGFQPPADDEAPINPLPKSAITDPVVIPDLSVSDIEAESVTANFGTTFPTNPKKGDLFLRVDVLPNRLFKWNEHKWIQIDRSQSESYAYDLNYIKHLIEKIDSNTYDIELLTDTEREQISRYLNNGTIEQ